MRGQINSKVLGATIVGLAFVAGAYTISNFGEPRRAQLPATVQNAVTTQRVAIEVTDNDNNGIEDWRDEFITTEPLVFEQNISDYEPPNTLTGQMSIGFMENVILSRGYGAFGSSDEEVIENTIDVLKQETAHDLYDTKDVTIMKKWDDEDVVNYANTVAASIYRHSVPDLEGELLILYDIVTNKNENRLTEIKTLARVYRGYRDDALKIPVPAFLAKEHLDLINTYDAILNDIEAMTIVQEDPAVTLLHLKRYQDDATGLGLAHQNMFLSLDPYSELFTAEDPATLFVVFSPNYQN